MNTKQLIAVVDDEELTRTWVSEHLGDAGYSVEEGVSGADALQLVRDRGPVLLLLDLRLPDANGVELMARLHGLDPDLVVIIVTAYGEIETAVDAVKAGAFHFMQKPLDLDALVITIEKALETRRLRHRVKVLQEQHSWQFADVRIVGRSGVMRELVQTVERVARAGHATVLLEGESGTGKDLVARAIHARSDRREQPFVQVNCTNLPEHLLESELFGHERGAFTDARERKRGLAELADGGTLFLDEIGDMPLGAQAKLLRFLEDSKFKRVGGTSDVTVDVRVVAATNRDLVRCVDERIFRSDLYYRLKVVPITLAPLRDRPEDIAPLAEYFVERLAAELKREAPALTEGVLRVLEAFPWPGNVRELRNILERVLILGDTPEIRPEDLPPEIVAPQRLGESLHAPALPTEGLRLADVERELIERAMTRTNGNVSKAARLLGVSRDALRYRLAKHGLAAGSTEPASPPAGVAQPREHPVS